MPDGAAPAAPLAPVWRKPAEDWDHRELYDRVIDAIYALPGLFESPLAIAGVRVADLHTLNTTLGASIEQSVVENLNGLRKIWDPDGTYQLYSFVRQPQSFPDVRLQTSAPGVVEPILLGIELKGWFALAKEGEPSFRYKVTPAACADADLLVVFPWVLSEVISGTPRLLPPFLTGAQHAAEHRNYYWQHLRGVVGPDMLITPALHQRPYPRKGDKISDLAVRDPGGNFGRVARGNFMSAFTNELLSQSLAGIPIGAWQQFFKMFTEGVTDVALERQLRRIQVLYREDDEEYQTDEEFAPLQEAVLGLLRAATRPKN
jgi:hypothetical protein